MHGSFPSLKVLSSSLQELLAVWHNLRDSKEKQLQVVGVKNTYAFDDEEAMRETNGMMQVLVSMLFQPQMPDGRPMTYRDLLDDVKGVAAASTAASAQNSDYGSPHFDHNAIFAKAAGANLPIKMIVEVQLHLQYYMEERKKTHLWFKVLRSSTMSNLHYDCEAYMPKN